LSHDNDQTAVTLQRRELLGCICALGLGLPGSSQAQAPDPAALQPPQVDDILTYAFGERAGQAVGVDDLEAYTRQVFAWPSDPVSGLVRSGSRMNQLVLVRLDPAAMSAETAQRSVKGLVAYTGICSHTGCDVTDWNSEFRRFQCPCHESQFDPADAARVVGGPAPWQLAALPLKEKDGKVAVAGNFEGRLGFPQPGANPFGI